MPSESSSAEMPATRRRRRQRTTRTTRNSAWQTVVGQPLFGKRLFAAMCVLGLLYAGTLAYQLRVATYFYGGLTLGMTKSEVRYMMGTPRATPSATTWNFLEEGRDTVVGFNPAGRLDSITCTSMLGRAGCQSIFGIDIGTTEDRVWLLLGKPDREEYGHDSKTIHYDGLGFSFRLSRFAVTHLQLRDTASIPGFIPRFLWVLVP